MLVIVYSGKTRRVELRAERPVIGAAFFRQQKNFPDANGSRLQAALLRYPITRRNPA